MPLSEDDFRPNEQYNSPHMIDESIRAAFSDMEVDERRLVALTGMLTSGEQKRLAASARTKVQEGLFYLRELVRNRGMEI